MFRTAVITSILFFLAAAPSPSGGDGIALLHEVQNALGGADRIAAVKDFDQTVLGTAFDGDSGRRIGEVRKRVRWIRPNHLRLDQVGPGDTYVLYFDGSGGWEILPDGSLHDLAGGELRFAQGYLRGFLLRQLLADRDPAEYVVFSPAPDTLRIQPKGEGGAPTDLIVDPQSRLPVKETSISIANPDQPVASETLYSEWKTVDGIRFAHRFTKMHEGRHVADAVLESTRLNTGLKIGDLAAKPADGKPVMTSGPAR